MNQYSLISGNQLTSESKCPFFPSKINNGCRKCGLMKKCLFFMGFNRTDLKPALKSVYIIEKYSKLIKYK